MSGVKDLEHNDVLLFQRQCRSLAKSASTGKHVSALRGRKELEKLTDCGLSDLRGAGDRAGAVCPRRVPAWRADGVPVLGEE